MKKSNILIVVILTMIFSLTSICGCTDLIDSVIGSENTEYYLNESEKNLVVGQSFVLTLYHKDPKTGVVETFDNITYLIKNSSLSSDNNSVATVDQKCNVVAVGKGSTTVYYSVGGVYTLKCRVNVIDRIVEKEEIVHFKEQYLLDSEFVFRGELFVTYTTDYFEQIEIESVDSSNVKIDTLGNYNITINYKIDGEKYSLLKQISVVDKLDDLTKTTLQQNLDDMEKASNFRSALSCKGTQKALAIPIKFSDSNNYISNYGLVKKDINSVLFGEGDSAVSWYSVKEYYEIESSGSMMINGKVSDWYEVNKPSTYYYVRENIVQLANDAIDWYFDNNPSEDRKSYDSDGDGYFDCLYIVYGSPDYVTAKLGSSASLMWASVLSQTATASVAEPALASIMWSSYDFIYGSKTYASLRTGKSDYAQMAYSGFAKDDKLHTATYIHETGHLLGLVDYYSNDGNHFSGSANMQTTSTFSHDPFSYLLLGWADPYIPNDSMTITINDFQYSHDLILLTPSWNLNNSPFDEYLLIELYTPTELNKRDAITSPTIYKDDKDGSKEDMQGVGIRLWHVDARLIKASNNGITTNAKDTATNFITDNTIGNVTTGEKAYYDKYAMLYQVRNNTATSFSTTGYSRQNDLFYKGDSFDMETYKNQFVNGNKLDSGMALGWSFRVDDIEIMTGGSAKATITLTRAK